MIGIDIHLDLLWSPLLPEDSRYIRVFLEIFGRYTCEKEKQKRTGD